MRRWALLLLLSACAGGRTDITRGTCEDPDLVDSCAAAVDQINICCAGTLHDERSGAALCAAEASPAQSCPALAGASCGALHDTLLGGGSCCCPAGQACDPNAGLACTPTCTTSADCPGSDRPDCAPSWDLSGRAPVIAAGPGLCQPSDGRAAHGCSDFCEGGLVCARRGGLTGFCSPSCSTDVECGNPGVACCNATSPGSPTGKACGPC